MVGIDTEHAGWAYEATIGIGLLAAWYKVFLVTRNEKRKDGEGADTFAGYRKLLEETRSDLERSRSDNKVLRDELDELRDDLSKSRSQVESLKVRLVALTSIGTPSEEL